MFSYPEMTRERAARVRALRVDTGLTWRGVAGVLSEEWGGDWGGSQIAGEDLCEQAARALGEDYRDEPWN